MSPDLYPLRPVYAIAGKHNRIMVAEQKIGTAWSNDCEPLRISPVHQCRNVDDCCVHMRCEVTAVIVILDFRRLTSTEVRYVTTVTN